MFPTISAAVNRSSARGVSWLYFLLEAEEAGAFYLIFDYRPMLPTAPTELAALPPEVLETVYAVLEFDNVEERDREVAAIRLSLRGDGDDARGCRDGTAFNRARSRRDSAEPSGDEYS